MILDPWSLSNEVCALANDFQNWEEYQLRFPSTLANQRKQITKAG